jgi:aspartyl-tRNA synthetase
VQARIFEVLGISEAGEEFGFLLEAFMNGAPPRGVIAFGWDRIVALFPSSDSIRDVIVIRKSGGGFAGWPPPLPRSP